jgi:hypothetical protein
MKKTCNFDHLPRMAWPIPSELKRYFEAPDGNAWPQTSGNDHWGLRVFPDMDPNEPGLRITDKGTHLELVGIPGYGVFVYWWRVSDGPTVRFYSKADPSKFHLQVRSLHSDAWPLGMFIPFATAWLAVEDFIIGNGARSTRIEWVNANDLPPNTFLDPHDATCVND